jgi:DNA mismatch repair ATPase MutL
MFEDLSLHILDIAENSVRAQARNIKIKIEEDMSKDLLVLEIKDDGKGMDKDFLRKALDPFSTTKPGRKVGLGLSFLAHAARMANGDLTIDSKEGKGTKIKAFFQHSHLDRQPLGDIKETLTTLIVGNPKINFSFIYKKNKARYSFDTRKLRVKNKPFPYNYICLMNYLNHIFERLHQEAKSE